MDPISTPTIEVPPVEPSHKKDRGIHWILIALVLVSLALCGYLLYQGQQLNKQLSDITSTAEPVKLAPSPTIDPTSDLSSEASAKEDWKTYTNPTYKFTFSYPPAYSLKENKGENYTQLVLDENGKHRIVIYSTSEPKLVSEPRSILQQSDTPIDFVGNKVSGNINWEEYKQSPQDYALLHAANGLAYMIDFQKADADIFDLILSTFKFE